MLPECFYGLRKPNKKNVEYQMQETIQRPAIAINLPFQMEYARDLA